MRSPSSWQRASPWRTSWLRTISRTTSRPEAGVEAQPFTTPGGLEVQSIVLKPTPITLENLNLVVDLGWITQDVLCAGVPAGTVEVCG